MPPPLLLQFKLVPVAVPTAVPTAAPSGCADDTSCTSCADTCPVIETYILIDDLTWSDGKVRWWGGLVAGLVLQLAGLACLHQAAQMEAGVNCGQ